MSEHDHLRKLPDPSKALALGYKSCVCAEPEPPHRQTMYDLHDQGGTLVWVRRGLKP